jgi:aldehyde dehydrogenase (NAD+)
MSQFDGRDRYEHYVDGAWHEPGDGGYFEATNPATGAVIARVADGTTGDVDAAVAAAREAFPSWRDADPVERGQVVHRVAELIREHADALAALESRDQGKPLSQAASDVEGAARYFEYYAGAADKLEGTSVPTGTGQMDFTVREPFGVSAQIIPWNFPGNLFARGVAPALVAGNATVVKPAPTASLSSFALVELCEQAGVPEGLVNVVAGGAEPGDALASHEGVDTVTFTGSVATGQSVMRAAADEVTPVTLELGGKNPAIVYDDADVSEAAEWVATAIFTNAGQVCSAADRALVHESVYDAFVDELAAVAESYELGPGAEDPDLGPLNSAEHAERVADYIALGREEGATVAAGGEVRDRPGNFVEPTVFVDVDNDMRVAQEEIFGPVVVVIPFGDADDPVEIANDVDYGLTAGVFTNDVRRALSAVRDIEAGNVYVNKWFGDTTQTPFGGYKHSGMGREKGLEALDSYLQTKNVAINLERSSGGDLPGA